MSLVGPQQLARADAEPPTDRPDLRKLDWQDLYPRLLLAARGRLQRMRWRGQYGGLVPGGLTAHDLVQTAIQQVIAGHRSWDVGKSPYQNFWNVISSMISNTANSHDNINTFRTEITEDYKVISLRAEQPSPEDSTIWRFERDHLLRWLEGRDSEVGRMANLMLVHELQGVELVASMGLTPQETDNVKKRLRRLITDYKANEKSY